MKKRLLACALCAPLLTMAPARAQESPAPKPLAARIGHTDPARFRNLESVHGGAGSMAFAPLLGADALSTNLIFIHRGVIAPRSGIGQHFHNNCEEMFVILDGDAEYTIDGRTSRVAGPAGAPDRLGHAHGIYNPTDKPMQWLNINVGLTKAYDNFDLNDPRVGVALDPIPQFMTMRLDRALLRPVAGMEGGEGTVQWRRALGPTVFSTPWSFVDHLMIPVGASFGAVTRPDMSEVYYVVSGEGRIDLGGESATIRAGDAVPVDLGQTHALRATGTAPLELMVIGVARDLAAKAAFMKASNPPRGAR
ncbi:cupin domain-containing protein [Sphingomonas sp. CJ20]